MMYEKYLFSSTNLKAKATKFIDKAQWQWLSDASYEDCIDWLKTTWYKPIVDQPIEPAFYSILLDDLKFLSKNLSEGYLKILVWDSWFHAQRYKHGDLVNPLVDFAERMEWKFEVQTLKALEQIWLSKPQEPNLKVDLLNLNVSFEYEKFLKSENIKSFWNLRNQLFLIKVLLRCRNLNLSCSELGKFQSLKVKDLLEKPFDDWYNLVPSHLRDPVRSMVAGKDADLVIKLELYRYAEINFKRIVSGPEVLVYYFYQKLWELEDLITLLECKKNNVPRFVWQERMMKLNA